MTSKFPRFRKCDWIDLETVEPMFGIEIHQHKSDCWRFLSEDKKPCLFKTEDERDSKLKELRKQAKTNPSSFNFSKVFAVPQTLSIS